MPRACRAPPPPGHLMGTSTHQSSSTTRTSTKNVFLLTRFLNVSAKGENFSYVECGLRKAILTQAGMGGGEGYLLPAAIYRALRTCRSPGREAPPSTRSRACRTASTAFPSGLPPPAPRET